MSTSSTTSTSTSTTTSIPVILGDAGSDDATSETPPAPFIPVLPGLAKPHRNPTLEKLLFQLTAAQRAIVVEAQAKADVAQRKVVAAEGELESISSAAEQIRLDRLALLSSIEQTKAKVRDRALKVYAGEQVRVLDDLLRAEDVSALARKIDYINQAQQLDAQLMAEFESQKGGLDAKSRELDALAATKETEIATLRAEEAVVAQELAKVQEQLSFVSNGTAIALGGFVFPIAGATSFVDTYGAPRMTGTKYAHFHEGTDVFANQGTPLVATNRGVIVKKGVGVLGGNKLWLVAADGTQYYYAHLSAFQPGIDDGTIVDAGQVIGYVGNTGNAITTPAHLHFEVHPGGGGPINPYPILDAVRRSDLTALLAASKTAAAAALTATTTTIPGQFSAGIGVQTEIAIDAVAAGVPVTTALPAPGSPLTAGPPTSSATTTTRPRR